MLKGLPFGARYYGDPALRRQVDVDLLVKERDAHRALRTMLGLGYGVRARRLARSPDGPVLRIDEDALWARSHAVHAGGVDCPVLDDEFALVLLLLSIAHDLGRGGCRLKHLFDVWHLLRLAPPDGDAFLARRAAEGTLGPCANALLVVLGALDAESEFPALRDALDRAEFPRAGDDPVALLHRRPGSTANAMWFARAYGVRWIRDGVWWIDRNLPHPARLPLALVRAGKFAAGSLRYAVRRIAGAP